MYIIAVAGKGGTGKTTLCALMVRALIERKAGSILAVDADPNSTLADALGLSAAKTIGQVVDELAAHQDRIPGGMTKDRYLEFEVQNIIEEREGFDLLVMGKPEGPGCYCYVNSVLKGVLERLVKSYDFTVIDNEAGLEHLSRKTVGQADLLVMVSDCSAAGMRAAQRIHQLAGDLKLKIGKKVLVVNRCQDLPKNETGLELCARVPQDEAVALAGRENTSLFLLPENSSAYASVRTLADIIMKK